MAVTTILFKRGNSPISQANLRPGEPGWTLDTGKLYIGIETEHGIESKLINVLDEQDVTELLARIASIEEGGIGESVLSQIMAEIDGINARINQLHPPPTYSYTRYAIDEQGTGFAKTFNPAIHKYKGVYVSLEKLTDDQVTVNLFEGLWEPYAPTYTYTRYASDDQGSNFSDTYVTGIHTHRAVITHTYLAPDDIV
ncbi:MAG: hypothetical protein RBS96_04045, partial [Dehalococcoidales bacterium]|nr:hypothetical protein [Dehalococcoidales bacterium]